MVETRNHSQNQAWTRQTESANHLLTHCGERGDPGIFCSLDMDISRELFSLGKELLMCWCGSALEKKHRKAWRMDSLCLF